MTQRWQRQRGVRQARHPLSEQAVQVLTEALPQWGFSEGEPPLVRTRRGGRAGKWRVYQMAVMVDPREDFTLTNGDRAALAKVFAAHYSGLQGQQGGPPALFDEAAGFLVERFPYDWKLPSLPAVLDPIQVGQRLAAVEELTDAAEIGAALRLAGLRHIPHKRALVKYAATVGDEAHQFYGKVYTNQAKLRRSFRAMQVLGEHPATAGLAPRPLLFDPGWHFLLMEALPGSQLSHLLDEAHDEDHTAPFDAIARTATLLAGIHSISGRGGGQNEIRSELGKFERLARRVPASQERVAATVHEMLGVLNAIAQKQEHLDAPRTLVHGDFNPRQILIDGETARVVDFDSSGYGDPAQDVGRFAASLRAQAIVQERPEFREYAGCFVAEYAIASGRDLSVRAGYYEVLALLYRAVRTLVASSYSTVDEPTGIIEEANARLHWLTEQSRQT